MKQPVLEAPANIEWDFRELIGEQFVVSVNIGPLGDILVLTRHDPPSASGSALRWPEDKPIEYTLHHLTREGLVRIALAPTHHSLWEVQPLPDDKYVAVKSRAGKDELNAYVYNRDGEIILSWAVGDGVESVQASRDGQIWVSYFDEGIYGNGGPGLNTYNAEGGLIFDFTEIVATSPLDYMSDCYALNVASNQEVWTCYYTDFPVVCLRDHRLRRYWPAIKEMAGTSAFAVFKDCLLFAGGYYFENQFFWHDLHRNRTVEVVATKPDGEQLTWFKRQHRVLGRGAKLYVEQDFQLWSLSLHELWPSD